MNRSSWRKYLAALLVLGAGVLGYWWREIPTLKLLSMILLMTGIGVLPSKRAMPAEPNADGATSNPAPARLAQLSKLAAPLLGSGALVFASHAWLNYAASHDWKNPWPLYVYAGAIGLFLWQLSGLFTRLFRFRRAQQRTGSTR